MDTGWGGRKERRVLRETVRQRGKDVGSRQPQLWRAGDLKKESEPDRQYEGRMSEINGCYHILS